MINQAQVIGAVRWIITAAGAFAVGRGWITNEQVALILGVAVAVVPLGWSFYSNTLANRIASVAGSSRVDAVITNDAKLADSVPSEKVVSQ